jgi:hypothetical protein
MTSKRSGLLIDQTGRLARRTAQPERRVTLAGITTTHHEVNPMRLTILYPLSVSLAAISLVAPMAHALELGNKIRLSAQDYRIVQQIYRGWAWLGAVIVLALLSSLGLTIAVRPARLPFAFALGGLLALAATQLIFWTYTYPVNRATRDWTLVPSDWAALRRQWEYSHAVNALLSLVALLALILSWATWPLGLHTVS